MLMILPKITSNIWQRITLLAFSWLVISPRLADAFQDDTQPAMPQPATTLKRTAERIALEEGVIQGFKSQAGPFLERYCAQCHNADQRESGIRIDHLNGLMEENTLALWKGIRKQVSQRDMPPEEEPQPTDDERSRFEAWLNHALEVARSREVPRNGIMRRLTVAQFRNTLHDLLKIDDDLADILPPDAVSKDGFTNNAAVMQLSPLQIESYFQIAERALQIALVDEQSEPTIQHFRMELGRGINPVPYPDSLVLGADNLLLNNADFIVSEPTLEKPFPFKPFAMQRKFRFIEGYQGNDTVRGWRDFDSIYHAVFACMRGTQGYPKGRAFETVPEGLLLRPAIPSPEIFGESNTYGPQANFKISLRELPDQGQFRVTVRAAKVADGLLVDRESPVEYSDADPTVDLHTGFQESQQLTIDQPGIYQVDVQLQGSRSKVAKPDASQLGTKLGVVLSFDEGTESDVPSNTAPKEFQPQVELELMGGARLVPSPFGNALSVDGSSGFATAVRTEAMNVGEGDFSIAAWINPHELRQGGILCLGGYGYTHGWIVDMPNNQGVLRIETANHLGQHNGTVESAAGIIRLNQWQHIAVVVKRGDQQTKLFVNGFEVAQGTINLTNLDNPSVKLHVGAVQNAQKFYGEIDEVRLYQRALGHAEIEALVEPGRKFATSPFPPGTHELQMTIDDRSFSGNLLQPAFMVTRLAAGQHQFRALYGGQEPIERVSIRKLNPDSPLGKQFQAFESRSPRLGVHVGLRRDCGSTLSQVGEPQAVASTDLMEYIFEGAINNFPSPDVEKDNVNYLAGIREIGVRSEFTDGRDMPRLLIHSVEFEGPYYDQWPPESHRSIFKSSKFRDQPERYAQEVLQNFATRAFRRPLGDEELQGLMQIWREAYPISSDFQQSVAETLIVVLTSPQFLFHIERSQTPEAEDVDEWELASKLSYFLWNTMPDDRLLQLAASNELRSSLDSEVDRMIADPRFRQFTNEFASQWMSLDKFEVVETDAKRFARLTRDVKTELSKEPARFLEYLIRNNLSAKNLVRSDFIVANEVIASYYGCGEKTESGFEFVPIEHRNEYLGGMLTQAAILAGLSDGREANPVKRGAWFARRIIAEPPDDPPPNVPKLEDLTHLSLRQRLEQHRNIEGCIKCHMGIDPWGLPFEQFDAGGLAKNEAADSRSHLPDGKIVSDFNAFREYLLTDRIDQVAFSTIKHLSAYAIGRSLTYNEDRQLRDKAAELRSDGYRMRDMIRLVIHGDLFLKK
jgi:Protein of unknown function (DUF1592)/Concanavalin A-like lectin/glucanases superfamily/Protein of unknown function (DUF1588)/Protein of unknown function (DUF1587)/Protein of unknown function (DUF1595)/Protein of unknown function (DUF1585)/Planctomycete cytochrome C